MRGSSGAEFQSWWGLAQHRLLTCAGLQSRTRAEAGAAEPLPEASGGVTHGKRGEDSLLWALRWHTQQR